MFTLLIVDDNPNDLIGIEGLIKWKELGIQIIGTATNGKEGYEKAMALQPDILLTDISMPIMNGVVMVRKLVKENPKLKIMFMSCHDDKEYLKNAIDLNIYAYLFKPINIKELTETTKKLVAKMEKDKEWQKNKEELDQRLMKSLPLMQESYLKELIVLEDMDMDEVREQMTYLRMNTAPTYCVISAQIDNYQVLYKQLPFRKKSLMLYSIKKCAEENMLDILSGYVSTLNEHTLIILLMIQCRDRHQVKESIHMYTGRVIESVNQQLGINITLGVSSPNSLLMEIPRLYIQSKHALQTKFLSQGNTTLYHHEEENNSIQYKLNLQNLMEDIRLLVLDPDQKSIQTFIAKYYEQRLSERDSKCLSYHIINNLQMILIEKNKSFAHIFDDELLIYKKLSLYETILDIQQFVYNLIQTVASELYRESIEKSHIIAKDIKNAIDQRYKDIDNVNHVVRGLDISASHGNYLFKQYMGVSIFDYLTLKRIEVAKAMLNNPYTKIYEIPEAIGYKNNAHFRSVFKQHVGMTPKQYQKGQAGGSLC